MALIFSTLNESYTRISAENGMSVIDFQMSLKGLFEQPRSDDDLKDHRLSRRSWKTLADEIMPVSRFLRFHDINSGRIRFPLNKRPPDCWLWKDGGDDPVGVEVTIAQARERYQLDRELVTTGQGRGFIGVSDDAPQSDFDRAMSRPREMNSTNQILSAIRSGICRCLSRKDKPKFAGFVLVIQAPLNLLPQERWQAIRGDLRAAAASLPFREVYVMHNMDVWGFQIK